MTLDTLRLLAAIPYALLAGAGIFLLSVGLLYPWIQRGALVLVVSLLPLIAGCTQSRFSAVSPSKACPDDARIVRENDVEYCVWTDKKTGREVRWRKPF